MSNIFGLKEGQQERKCPNCRKVTIHNEHGFIGHNYRLSCKECQKINYEDYE